MSNETGYSCCAHRDDVPPFMRCPDVRSKRPAVNVYLDVDGFEDRLKALEESQNDQNTVLSDHAERLDYTMREQSDQNAALYKHADRLAELEDAVNHKLLPYIYEDDDRDEGQKETLAKHARKLHGLDERVTALENSDIDSKIEAAVKELKTVIDVELETEAQKREAEDLALSGRIAQLGKDAAARFESIEGRHAKLVDDLKGIFADISADQASQNDNIESLSTDLTKVMTVDVPLLKKADEELKQADEQLDARVLDTETALSEAKAVIVEMQKQHEEDVKTISQLQTSLTELSASVASVVTDLAAVKAIVETDKGYTFHQIIDMIQENSRQIVRQTNVNDTQAASLTSLETRVKALEDK